MKFAHDTSMALLAAAALANTLPEFSDSGEEELATGRDVAGFAEEHQYSGRVDGTASEAASLQAIRSEILEVWHDDGDAVATSVNRILREYEALPQLVRHDGWDWHVHAVEAERPFADRIMVEFALAVIDLVRADELRRLRRCAAEDCAALFVDLSRNRSKRYCDVGNCGNRAHVAAYRSRRATADT